MAGAPQRREDGESERPPLPLLRGPLTWRGYSPQSGSLRCALKLTTLSPKGWASGSWALDEAEEPTLPGSALLTKSAKQFARWGFAAPDADGARAPRAPRLASSRTATRRGIASSLSVIEPFIVAFIRLPYRLDPASFSRVVT